MFNDEDVKKSVIRGLLYVFCFLFIIVALVLGVVFSIMDKEAEEAQKERDETFFYATVPTVEYEKDAQTDELISTQTNTECEHNWIISDEYLTLIRTVNLECVASEGIEKVYLTRYRGAFDHDDSDVYIAYDENLQDITLQDWDGVFQIEYFPAGVGMGTPRLEEYEFTLYACENENCNELKHVPRDKTTLYRFYIPEGTYLITH